MKQIVVIIFLALFHFVPLFSNEKKKLMEKAEHAFYDRDFSSAYDSYNKLAELLPDAKPYYEFKKAACMVELEKSPKNSLQIIESYRENFEGSEMADEYYYYLAKAYHLNGQFDEAATNYQKSLDAHGPDDTFFAEQIEHEKAISSNAKKEYAIIQDYEIINLGAELNSEFPDYKPVVNADESSIIFTSRRSDVTGQKKDIDGKYFEDIYISQRNSFGYWEQATKVTQNVNTEDHEASVGLSADGRKLLFYKGDKNSGNLFSSFLEGETWGTPVAIDNGQTINTKKAWETSASMNLDETEIYFTSDRKGGKGGLDIYKSKKLANGEWGNPVAQEALNTPFDEESPFIHPDGKTLYFSSNGNGSTGGYDIFRTTLENGQWTNPVNMGYPINTVYNDLYFSLTVDGKKAYFSSSRNGGEGAEDIFSVSLDEDVRPLVLIKGIVRSEDNSSVDATIDVFSKQDNKKQKYIYNPNKKTGKYLMILPPGKSYDMIVQAEGYENYQLDLNIPDQEHFHEFYQEIILRKVKVGDTLREEILVVNSFEDLRMAENLDPKLKQANPEYLKELVQDIAALTDSSANDPKAQALLDQKLSKVEQMTDPVQDGYDRVKDTKSYTEAVTYTNDKVTKDSSMQAYITGEDTIMVVPYDRFKEASLNKNEQLAEGVAVKDAKDQAQISAEADAKNNQEIKNKLPEDVIVYFDFNSAILKDEYKNRLTEVLTPLKADKTVYLTIEGHTDAMGSNEYNQSLSRRRAQVVSNYIQQVLYYSKNRINIEFFGEEKPAAPNVNPDGSDNPNGRDQNRRAVVRAKIK